MTITELQQQYAVHPNVTAMNRLLKDVSVKHIFCGGLCASSASLFFSVLVRKETCPPAIRKLTWMVDKHRKMQLRFSTRS